MGNQLDTYTDIMTEYKKLQKINKKLVISIEILEVERQMLSDEINKLSRKTRYVTKGNQCGKEKDINGNFSIKHQENIKTNRSMAGNKQS